MTDDIHRAALRATAKVALSLTVFGCGGSVEVQSPTEGPIAGAGGAPTPQHPDGGATPIGVGGSGGTQGMGGSEPTLMCSATEPPALVSIDPAAFGCCVDFLGEQALSTWQQPTEELIACCHEVVGQIDQDPALTAQIDPALVAPIWPEKPAPSCCDVLGNPCTMPCGCTVWGPPVPYGVRGRLLMLDELEVA
jgi:hypothetical protein